MDTQRRPKLEITDRQGNRIVSENSAGTAIATLQGVPLGANRGTSLNLDWVESVRVNLSAVERRGGTLGTRRTVEKGGEMCWPAPATSSMDLPTPTGGDTDQAVCRLWSKGGT